MTQKILILGAGITGLSLAYFLEQKGDVEVTILEGSERAGGWMRSEIVEGFLFERGPRSLRPGSALKLAKELGLPVIEAVAKQRYLYVDGELELMRPNWMLLKGIMRDVVRGRYRGEDQSIYDFFRRRLGKSVTEKYVSALVKGIYGGDMHTLSMRSCFPNVWKRGSVIKGAKRGGKGLYSFEGGIETLARELAKRANIVYGAKVEMVHEGMVVAGGKTFEADRIYSTLPAHALGIEGIPSKTLTLYNVGYHRPVIKTKGFGYLVPNASKILGVVFDSEVFPQQKGLCRMTVMTDGASQEEVLEHLKVEPDVISRFVAKQAVPQYQVGHRERVMKIIADNPHLTLLGSNFYGVSINDCIEAASYVS